MTGATTSRSRGSSSSITRSEKWWASKVTPLLGSAYLALLIAPRPAHAAVGRLALIVTSACALATAAYVVNDWFDRESDRELGKESRTGRLRAPTVAGLLVVLWVAGIAPWVVVGLTLPAWVALGANAVLPLVYSAPPIRWKERGALGLAADAGLAHVAPTVFALACFGALDGGDVPAAGRVAAGAAIVWSLTAGLRMIIGHELLDAAADRAAGVTTWVVEVGEPWARAVARAIVSIEVTALTAIAISLWWLSEPAFVAVAVVFVVLVIARITGAWTQPLTAAPSGHDGRAMLQPFYRFWLPLPLLIGLIAEDVPYAIVAAVHLGLFWTVAVEEAIGVAGFTREHLVTGLGRWIRFQLHPWIVESVPNWFRHRAWPGLTEGLPNWVSHRAWPGLTRGLPNWLRYRAWPGLTRGLPNWLRYRAWPGLTRGLPNWFRYKLPEHLRSARRAPRRVLAGARDRLRRLRTGDDQTGDDRSGGDGDGDVGPVHVVDPDGRSSHPIVVVGAGVGGLFTALALADAGHRVVVLERDGDPTPADVEQAFSNPRPGVPQALQTHGFLARLGVVLRTRFPDLLSQIDAAGGGWMSLTTELGPSEPGDDDLRVMVLRRSTFDWVLRRHVEAHENVEICTGVAVAGLVSDGVDRRGRRVVTGVRMAGDRVIEARSVVASTGSHGNVAGWLDAIGVACSERVVSAGFVYFTRWYRTTGTGDDIDPKLVGSLPFLRYLAVPGDGDTLSITLAVRSDDRELRRSLGSAPRFDRACSVLSGPDRFFAADAPPLTPLGDVRPMAGLVNRLRSFTDDDGAPTVLGFHAVGDAHTTTNPLYGRGVTLAAVQAVLLADAFAAHPDDAFGRAVAFEAASQEEVEPWFHLSAELDALEAGQGDAAGPSTDLQLLGGLSAAASDPILGRAFARLVNTLVTPGGLLGDDDLVQRLMTVMSDPERLDPPPPAGPSRDELVAMLDAVDDDHRKDRTERRVIVDDVTLHVVEAGPVDGPAVVLVHGFPELSYSWRHQIDALAAAGYRVVAPDQRGYGRSSRPDAVEAYDIHHLTGDLIGLLDEAGYRDAVFVGHDWGAFVVGHVALLHPDRVRGVLTMSVPPLGRGPVSILEQLESKTTGFFYMRYFQEIGPADADLGRSPGETISRMLAGTSADGPPPDGSAGLVDRLPTVEGLPPWLDQDDLDHYIGEFTRTGFTGAINWYRNLDRNWATTPELADARLTVPTAHIVGELDTVADLIPASMMDDHVTDHRFTVVVDGAGHWVQQERPEQVNDLVLRFLRSIDAAGDATAGREQ